MVDLEPLIDADDADFVQVAMMKHITLTGSRYAERLLADWGALQRTFVKVMPRDYKRVLLASQNGHGDALDDHVVSSGGEGFLTTESETAQAAG
jgi:glutamate synthase domain-containing protein 3